MTHKNCLQTRVKRRKKERREKTGFSTGDTNQQKHAEIYEKEIPISLISSTLIDKIFMMRNTIFDCVLISILAFTCSSSAEKMSSVSIATYEEVKDLPNHPEKLLIDVREKAEIAETGSIPKAINIPCKLKFRCASSD